MSTGGDARAQYATLQKYFSHPSLVVYFFPTPSIKRKLEQQIGGSSVSSFFWRILAFPDLDSDFLYSTKTEQDSKTFTVLSDL